MTDLILAKPFISTFFVDVCEQQVVDPVVSISPLCLTDRMSSTHGFVHNVISSTSSYRIRHGFPNKASVYNCTHVV